MILEIQCRFFDFLGLLRKIAALLEENWTEQEESLRVGFRRGECIAESCIFEALLRLPTLDGENAAYIRQDISRTQHAFHITCTPHYQPALYPSCRFAAINLSCPYLIILIGVSKFSLKSCVYLRCIQCHLVDNIFNSSNINTALKASLEPSIIGTRSDHILLSAPLYAYASN